MTSHLEIAGLDQRLALVYEYLVTNGAQSPTAICTAIHLSRPIVYESLDKLDLLGLVTRIPEGKRTLFGAVHPYRIKQRAQTAITRFTEEYEQLKERFEANERKSVVEVYSGSEHIKAVYEEIFTSLASGENVYFFSNMESIVSKDVMNNLSQKLIALAPRGTVYDMVINNEQGKQWFKKVHKKQLQNYHVRCVTETVHFQSEMIIVNDSVYFPQLLEKYPAFIHISSRQTAVMLRSLFLSVWENTNK